MENEKKKKNPVIGFIGLALAVVGCGAYALADSNLFGFLGLVGAIILAYALFTGNVKLFG